MWAGLNNNCVTTNSFRWTIGAKELCSGKGIINDYFEAGKIITVVRGKGVYQKELDKAVKNYYLVSKNKAFSVVPTTFKPSYYLNPLKYKEDGNEHFMINGIQLLRSQFTNILKEGLISLKKETLDWILNQQSKQPFVQTEHSINNDRPLLNDEFHKRFRINIIYENQN
ncbi:hypothetical protein U3516DRAFT_662873 [Neocallimastix sp. 'constans']